MCIFNIVYQICIYHEDIAIMIITTTYIFKTQTHRTMMKIRKKTCSIFIYSHKFIPICEYFHRIIKNDRRFDPLKLMRDRDRAQSRLYNT